MSSKPVVSVLMPVYNGEQYIAEAIESVLQQTFRSFELIIINDGSTDRTVDVIRKYSDPRIRLVEMGANSGVIATLNRGIDEATGEYIARLDADDAAFAERFEKQVDFFEKNPGFGLCGSSAVIIDKTGKELFRMVYHYQAAEIPSHLLFRNVFIHSSIMVRAAILKTVRYDMAYYVAEDYFAWIRIATNWSVYTTPECLVKHRVHDTNVSKLKQDHANRTIDNIYRYQLLQLGITASDQEIVLHRKVGNYLFEGSESFLVQSENWLAKLHAANERLRRYEPAYFNAVLGNLWFNILSAGHQLGWRPYQLLKKSPVSKYIASKQRWKLQMLSLVHVPVLGWTLKPLYFIFKKVA